MEKRSNIAAFSDWLSGTELFGRPAKQLPGKWQLFEYYFDGSEDLKHVTSSFLEAEKQFWNLEFTGDGNFIQNSDLPVSLVSAIENGSWSTAKNFITLTAATGKATTFQFAIAKGTLKLLKKEGNGQIEFFGFFRKLENPANGSN